MGKKVSPEHRMIAVYVQDLRVLKEFPCVREGRPCTPEQVEQGACCNACWTHRFAKKALNGESVKAAERDQPKNIDVWDLLHGFQDTVEQLGGALEVDLERALVWLRPPKFGQWMELKLRVVSRVPREGGRRCPECGSIVCNESAYSPRDALALYCGDCGHEWEVSLR